MMKRRFRKKSHNSQGDRRSINPLKHSYESGGSGSRMRGNAQQLHEKYMTLGREAKGNGDRIMMEHFFQYAEHYQRQINQYQENMETRQQNWDDFGDSPKRNHDRNDRNQNSRRHNAEEPAIEEDNDSLPIPGPINASSRDENDEPPSKKTKATRSKPRPPNGDDTPDEDML